MAGWLGISWSRSGTIASFEAIRGICGRAKRVILLPVLPVLPLLLLPMLPLECDFGIVVGSVDGLMLLRWIVGLAVEDLSEGRRINFDCFDGSPALARREGLAVDLQAFAWGMRDDDVVDP